MQNNKCASAITCAGKLKESSEQKRCEYSSDGDCSRVCRQQINVMYGLNKNEKENNLEPKQTKQIEINADFIEVDDFHQEEISHS